MKVKGLRKLGGVGRDALWICFVGWIRESMGRKAVRWPTGYFIGYYTIWLAGVKENLRGPGLKLFFCGGCVRGGWKPPLPRLKLGGFTLGRA